MKRLFKQFSFPGGIPSSLSRQETPGSIHEGGELAGYSLAHAYGAAFDNPDLVGLLRLSETAKRETGPLAASWHSNKFLNPIHDGAVLPILHLNGYKINNPTVLARIWSRRTRPTSARIRTYAVFRRRKRPGRSPSIDGVDARQSFGGHSSKFKPTARNDRRFRTSVLAGMIVLQTPKGWTGPKEVDGLPTENSWRSHQVPFSDMTKPGHLKLLEDWMKSYKPEELFDEKGR